jgi:cytochrome c-type biogenesis protein CcmH
MADGRRLMVDGRWGGVRSGGRLLVCSLWLVLIALLMTAPLMAAALTQEQIDAEAKEIDRLVMAPCCWTQPVSDHYSGVASEIRQGIRKMLAEGKTRQEILDVYVAQYGERILSMPKAEGFNLMAYVLPALALLLGAIVVRAVIRAWHRPTPAAAPAASSAASTDDYARRLEDELKARE